MLPNFISDVMITHAPVPSALDGATARGVLWQATAGRFLLDMPGVARYLVEAGRKVTIEVMRHAHESAVEYFFRMSPLAALLYQRGLVVLHAAAAANSEGAVLLVGDSWGGKSSLLTALLQRDWKMLADDLAIVTLDEQGQLLVQPTYFEIALWPDAVKKLEIDSGSLQFCDANRQKLIVSEQVGDRPLPLKAIYWLNVHSNSSVTLEKLAENACYREVGTFLYNSQIADILMDKGVYLHFASTIARTVPIYDLCRPRSRWSVSELADQILI